MAFLCITKVLVLYFYVSYGLSMRVYCISMVFVLYFYCIYDVFLWYFHCISKVSSGISLAFLW